MLAKLKYAPEDMDRYLSKWEKRSAQLTIMGSPLDEILMMSMSFDSFGSRIDSRLGRCCWRDAAFSSSGRRGPKPSRGYQRDCFDLFGNDNKYA